MFRVRSFAIASIGAVATVFAFASVSPAQTAQLCLAGQLRAASNTCKAVAKCHAVAFKKGGSAAACVASRIQRLTPLFAELEALSPCLVEGAASAVASAIAADVADIAAALTPAGGKCAATKMAALGKECAGYLRCYAAAAGDSETVDAGCLAVHESRLARSFTQAEARGGCSTTGDAATLQARVGDTASGAYATLRGTGTTTTVPTTSSTSTVTLP